MSASRHLPATSYANGLRATSGRLAAGAALGACALLAGCSGGAATASGTSAGRGAAVGVAAGSQAAPEAVPAALPGAAGKQNPLPALLPASQAVIYSASLTVRAGDVRAAAARAARLAGSAGGYVSSETARFNHRHPADGTILIQLKIPVASYQATLAALSTRLGTRLSAVPSGATSPRRSPRDQPGGPGQGGHHPAAPAARAGPHGQQPADGRGPDQRRGAPAGGVPQSPAAACWRMMTRTGRCRCRRRASPRRWPRGRRAGGRSDWRARRAPARPPPGGTTRWLRDRAPRGAAVVLSPSWRSTRRCVCMLLPCPRAARARARRPSWGVPRRLRAVASPLAGGMSTTRRRNKS